MNLFRGKGPAPSTIPSLSMPTALRPLLTEIRHCLAYTIRAVMAWRSGFISVASVCLCVFVCQLGKSWTVWDRPIIVKFLWALNMGKSYFQNGCTQITGAHRGRRFTVVLVLFVCEFLCVCCSTPTLEPFEISSRNFYDQKARTSSKCQVKSS